MEAKFKQIKKYESPKNDSIVVCTVFFNAGNFIKPVMNNLYVSNILRKSNIPQYILELLYPGQEPSFEGENVIHLRANSYMFHKENLFNLLVEKLPKNYAKIVCMDGDVIFENEDWINDLDKELDMHDVVVPYHDGCNLDPYYENVLFNAKTLLDTRYDVDEGPFCSGYAIAFRRDYFEKIGMYEYAIFGGGDKMNIVNFIRRTIMINSFNSTKKDEHIQKLKDLNLSYSYLGGIIYHLYHGNATDRKYLERHDLLKNLNLDLDIIKNADGVLEFKEPHKYNPIMKDYFFGRREDFIDPNSL